MNRPTLLAPPLLFAVLLSNASAFAQNATLPPGGAANPTVLDQLQKLQTAINALDAKVSTIQASMTAIQLSSDDNVRYSPPVFVGGAASVVCSVSNVGSAPHRVKMEVIFGDFGTVKSTPVNDLTLQPGEGTVASQQVDRGVWYCRLTALDGTRSDIRALAQILDTTGAALPTATAAD